MSQMRRCVTSHCPRVVTW